MATPQPLRFIAGESWSIRIDNLTDAAGDPIDPAEASAIEFQVKQRTGDDDPPIVSKSLGDGIEVDDGEILITGEAADFAGMRGIYAYDCVMEIAGRRLYVAGPAALTLVAPVNPP